MSFLKFMTMESKICEVNQDLRKLVIAGMANNGYTEIKSVKSKVTRQVRTMVQDKELH